MVTIVGFIVYGMLKVKKQTLLLVAAIVWIIAGVSVVNVGAKALISLVQSDMEWLWLVLTCMVMVFVGFFFMFKAVVRKHTMRILGYQDKKTIFLFFDLKGYLLMAFMMGLGITLRVGNFLPTEFFAAFYNGLGSGLMVGGIIFLINYVKHSER